MTPSSLLELAEKIEKASGPDRRLDAEIAKLCAPTDDPRMAAFENGRDYPDRYTSSIEAAMTLVPEGWEWLISNRAQPPKTGRAYLNNRELINVGRGGLTPNPKYKGAEITAATPALALCAAALRACAAQASEEVK